MGENAKRNLLVFLSYLFIGICWMWKNHVTEPKAGFYEVSYELPWTYVEGLTFTPWVRIDPPNQSFQFFFGSDPRPSSSGYYVIEDDILTAFTWEFDIVFEFQILNHKTLKLIGCNKTLGDELFAIHTDTAQIGDVFFWSEDLPEKESIPMEPITSELLSK